MTAQLSVDWFGDRAVLVSCRALDERARVARTLSRLLPEDLVRSGMTTVLVESTAPDADLLGRVESVLDSVPAGVDAEVSRGRTVDIVVEYDGPDLALAAAALGLTADELVSAHGLQSWRVAMMGFAPGFGYLVPEGDAVVDWSALARRDDPRALVPPGSVAIAAGMSAVYPAAMPGGWHLIGRTQVEIFVAERSAPALLAPDDVVRFLAGPR